MVFKEETGAEVLGGLVKPHIDSFDYFAERGLAAAVPGIPPIEVTHPLTNVHLRCWIERPVISPPMKDSKEGAQSLDQRLLPSECRQAGLSYKGSLTADLCLQWNDGNTIRHSLSFGRMPIMVKSSCCHLRGLDQQRLIGLQEEAMEMGGYFICNGIERIIRLLIIPKRNLVMGLKRNTFRNRGSSYTDKAVVIRCVRQDQTAVTMRLYYLQQGSATLGFLLRKQEFLIPVGIMLKALLDTSDREVFEKLSSIQSENYNKIKGAVSTPFANQRARIILDEVRRLNLFTRFQCLQYIGERFKPLLEVSSNLSYARVGSKILEDFVLVHLDSGIDKFNLLIFMLQKLFALADGTAAADNSDSLQFHEILLPGHLLTMYVKERMQEWLVKAKGYLVKELEDKPAQFNLQDVTQVYKIIDKASSSDVAKKVEYLLNTGNLVTQTGLDLQQATGFTLVAEKLNFFRYISHFRSVHRGAYFSKMRTTDVRKLLPESWGFLCPVHTPDGSPCGLLNHLTAGCLISSDLDSMGALKQSLKIRKAITCELVNMGMLPVAPYIANVACPAYLAVLLDGRIIGHIQNHCIVGAVAHLRHLKVTKSPEVPEDLEIAHVPCTTAGAYPGLFLFTTPARMLRTVRQLGRQDNGAVELVAPYEQAYMQIKCPDGGEGGTTSDSSATHEELDAMRILSVVASLTPWSDHNQSPRNMYQCQMGKQTMGTPAQALPFRADGKLYRLQTPQTPVARTEAWKKYSMDDFPTGTNAIVAVLAYTGYDMEDAMILNKSSMERGMCHGQIYKTETVDLTRMRKKGDGIINVFGKSGNPGGKRGIPSQDAPFVDTDGLPYIGQILNSGDAYCSVLNTVTGQARLSKLKGSEAAVVDYVAAVGTGPKEPVQKVNIRMRQGRNPVIGDKFSSRHGQKGVLSQLWPDVDMPFSDVTGMRPDIIINPHAFPSRMTIGMLLESLGAKVGCLAGKFVDATPFQKTKNNNSSDVDGGGTGDRKTKRHESAIDSFGKQLKEFGFNYHGTEVMYSGLLGTELTLEIYFGVVYYQRLRHMVSDKFQVRSLGAVNPVTRQPVKGRKFGGGIRFGEMERDALLAHGAAYLLHDRLHTCSDYHCADVCTNCGSMISPTSVRPNKSNVGLVWGGGKGHKVVCRVCDSNRGIERVAMPYVFRYLAAELAAMNIKLTLQLSNA